MALNGLGIMAAMVGWQYEWWVTSETAATFDGGRK
jgi:hypothetical protein